MHRPFLVVLSIAASALAARAQVVDQKLLVADPLARHNPDFPETGTLFLQSVNGLPGTIYFNEAPLRSPYCVDVDRDGRVLVADRSADLPGVGGVGAVFRFDPISKQLQLSAGSDEFVAICDVDVLHDGRILVVDRDANPLDLSQSDTGAVFAIDPTSGEVSVFSSPPELVDPYGVVVDSTGAVFVLDENANPQGHEGDSGCIWELSPADGSVLRLVSSPPEFSTPLDAVALDGFLYVLDATAEVSQSSGDSVVTRPSGTVFKIDATTGALSDLFVFTPFFVSPADIEVVDGKLYMIDKDIDFDGEGGAQGGLYVIDLDDPSGIRPRRLATSDLWGDPRSIVLLPTARIGIPTHSMTDLNGAALNPGDRIHVAVDLENLVTFTSGFSFVDSLPPFVEIDEGTLSVTTGSAVLVPTDPPVINWTGTLPPDGATSLRFDASIGAIERLRQPLWNRLTVTDESGGSVVSAIADTAFRSLHDDEVLITDPVSFFSHGQLAAVRGDGRTSEVLISSSEPVLDNPNGIVVDTNGTVYFVDPIASVPPDTTNQGAIFKYTPLAGTIEVLATNPAWEDPTALAIDAEGQLYLLDTAVRLPSGGTGAVYRLDAATGEIRETIIDPRWELPVGLATTTSGDLLIVDRVSRVGGHPGANGAIFRVDVDRQKSVDATSHLFRAPVGIATLGSTDYFVADFDANTVFRVRNGTVTSFSHEPEFLSPWGLTIARTGSLLMTDPGASRVYKIDVDSGEAELFIDIPELSAPQGIATLLAPRFEDSSVISYDLDGGTLVPGDGILYIIQIRNTGTLHDSACHLTIDVPPYVLFEEGSETASSGTVSFDPVDRRVEWVGPVPVGSIVNVNYEAQVSPAVGAGTKLLTHAVVDPLIGVTHEFTNTVTVSGSFRPGDVLVLDPDSTPPGGAGRGSIFRRNFDTNESELVIGGAPFELPVAIGIDSQERALILDQAADPLGIGGNHGALFRFDALEQELSVISASPSFDRPTDFLPGPTDDTFLVLDRDANPFGLTGLPGAIFEVDASTGAAVARVSDVRFINPTAFLYEPDGTVLIVDPHAFPTDGGTGRGVVFRANVETGAVTPYGSDDDWLELVDIARHPNGDILVADLSADPGGYGTDTGAVFRIARDTGEVSVFIASPTLRNPTALFIEPDGRVLVLDRGNASVGPKVWWVNEEAGLVQIYWNLPDLVRPQDVLVMDVADLQRSAFTVRDVNGSPLMPGDHLEYALNLRNSRPVTTPLLVEIDLPGDASLSTGSVETEDGTATVARNTIFVATTLGAEDSTHVTFELDVHSPLGEGVPIPTVARVDAGNGVARTIVDQRRIPLSFEPNDLLVLDRLASSGEVEQGSGVVFKWDDSDEALAPLSSLLAYLRLESMVIDPMDSDFLFVVDSETNAIGAGPTGAVFRTGSRDGRIERIYSSPEWVTPTGVFFDASGDLVVADINADPTHTGAASGALFRVDRESGAVTSWVTHPSFQQPRNGVVLGDGSFLVVDRGANPHGLPGNVGTLFRVDPETGVVLVEKTGGLLSDPVSIGPYREGSYLIVDESSDPAGLGGTTGAILLYDAENQVLLPLATSPLFVVPVAAKAGAQGEVYVADRLTDPNGTAPGRGAILRWDPNDASTRVYAFDAAFRSPLGVDFIDAPTPVQLLDLHASEAARGHVHLEWAVFSSDDLVRADIYRSLDTPGKTTPEPHDRLTGEGIGADDDRYDDHDAPTRGVATYWVSVTDREGRETVSRAVELELHGGAPRAYALHAIRPNPFSSTTSFGFDVPLPGGLVKVEIFDIGGRSVRTLFEGVAEPGVHALRWDGTLPNAKPAAAGVYFARLVAGGFSDTRRVVLVR